MRAFETALGSRRSRESECSWNYAVGQRFARRTICESSYWPSTHAELAPSPLVERALVGRNKPPWQNKLQQRYLIQQCKCGPTSKHKFAFFYYSALCLSTSPKLAARWQHGYIAQWVERLTADQQVPGPNLGVPSSKIIHSVLKERRAP